MHHDVPGEVARSCEKKLLEQGFYSPQILAAMEPSHFNSALLSSIGIQVLGLQELLMRLQQELYKDRESLWTGQVQVAIEAGKKRARK